MNPTPCWCCGAASESRHHLKPKRHAGPDAQDNLLDLCNDCHRIVDCTDQPTKDMLDRILAFPRIHLLMSIRSMADIAAIRKCRGTQRQVAKWALRAMDEPANPTVREKLQGALDELSKQTGAGNAPKRRRYRKPKNPTT